MRRRIEEPVKENILGNKLRHLREQVLHMTLEQLTERLNIEFGVMTEALAQQILDDKITVKELFFKYPAQLWQLRDAIYASQGGVSNPNADSTDTIHNGLDNDRKQYLADNGIDTAAKLVERCEERIQYTRDYRDRLLPHYSLTVADIDAVEKGENDGLFIEPDYYKYKRVPTGGSRGQPYHFPASWKRYDHISSNVAFNFSAPGNFKQALVRIVLAERGVEAEAADMDKDDHQSRLAREKIFAGELKWLRPSDGLAVEL